MGDLNLTDEVSLQGAGASLTIIDGGGIDRVLSVVSNPSVVTISDVTIQGGHTSWGNHDGGGISHATGTLMLARVVVQNNLAESDGGGISSNGVLIVEDSTITGNEALSLGGAMDGPGTIADWTITNSTISGNSALTANGIRTAGTVDLLNTTISEASNAIRDNPSSTVTLTNTVIDGGCTSFSSSWTSLGGNLESPADSCRLTHPTDQPAVGGLGLVALADNGGPTPTHALVPGSPAIDAGQAAPCPATDQRGVTRPLDGDGDSSADCDAGAFEAPTYDPQPMTFNVSKTEDTNDGLCDADCSLREAVIGSNLNPEVDTIVVPAGTYSLTIAGSNDDAAETGDLDLTDSVILQGAGASSTIIQQTTVDRVFEVLSGSDVDVSGVTVTGGDNVSLAVDRGEGGGFRVETSTLDLTDVVVDGNASKYGGAINADDTSTVTALRSTFSNNYVESLGSGIEMRSGDLHLEDSSVHGNHGDLGWGIRSVVGDTTIVNSTVSGNTASNPGYDKQIRVSNGDLVLSHATVVANPGGLSVAYTGALATIHVENSLLVGDCENPQGAFTSGGGNVESPSDTCGLNDPTDQVNVPDPLLGALADNGGPTLTHELLIGSAAIDAALPGACPAADQRGVARPEDGDGDTFADCDAGAYEAPELVIAPLPTPADAFCSAVTAAGDKVVVDRGTVDGDARSTGVIQTKRGGVITGAQFPNDPSVDYANVPLPGGIPNFGNLVLTGTSTFELPAGESVVTKLNISDSSTVTVAGTANDPSILYVDSTVAVKIREDAQLNGGGDPAALILIELNGENVQFQNDSISAAAVFAPDSTVTVNRADVTGAVVGNRVNVKNSSGLITESLVRCP